MAAYRPLHLFVAVVALALIAGSCLYMLRSTLWVRHLNSNDYREERIEGFRSSQYFLMASIDAKDLSAYLADTSLLQDRFAFLPSPETDSVPDWWNPPPGVPEMRFRRLNAEIAVVALYDAGILWLYAVDL